MAWKRAGETYGATPEPVTPYQRAAQVWDDRIGSARVQARNWRLMAFGSFALTAVLCAALVWMSTQSRVAPYVVEVDTLGEVRAVGPADARYQPSDAQIALHLATFIRNVRGVSIDPVVVRQNWLAAYDAVTSQAAQTLNEYASANDPFAEIGRRSVSVDITSIVRAGPDSFTVRWIERVYRQGALVETRRFTAVLSIVIEPPADEETLRKNPLGVYVHGLNWSQDLSSEES
jgi:type IV secretory pathway TrbF-like protein